MIFEKKFVQYALTESTTLIAEYANIYSESWSNTANTETIYRIHPSWNVALPGFFWVQRALFHGREAILKNHQLRWLVSDQIAETLFINRWHFKFGLTVLHDAVEVVVDWLLGPELICVIIRKILKLLIGVIKRSSSLHFFKLIFT